MSVIEKVASMQEREESKAVKTESEDLMTRLRKEVSNVIKLLS